jgi:hypothetical protein
MASDNTELVTPGPPLTEDLPVPTFRREICRTSRPCAFWKNKEKEFYEITIYTHENEVGIPRFRNKIRISMDV